VCGLVLFFVPLTRAQWPLSVAAAMHTDQVSLGVSVMPQDVEAHRIPAFHGYEVESS